MTNIAKFFECKINYISTNEMTFLVQANNKHSLTSSYFDKYPLMTSKYLGYLCFVKGLNYLGKRLIEKKIEEICEIKNYINNNRTYFN